MEAQDHSMHVSASAESATSSSAGVQDFFSQAGFMPHGHCYLWKPELVWTHFVSDLLIGLAYLSISITLYLLVRRIKLQFSLVILCFGVFIGACGLTHFMEIWTLWNPDYWASGWVKAITAWASVGTGVYLFKLRHPIMTVAEAAKLSEQRRLDLEALTKDLETRVEERTKELQASQSLLLEVTNALPSIVAQMDLEYRYRLVNETFEEWMNFSKNEAIGLHSRDVLGEEGYQIVKPYLDRASRGEKVRFEAEINYRGAGKKYVQANYVPKYKNGKVDGIIALINDLTKEKEQQEKVRMLAEASEKDRLQMKSVFNSVSDGIIVTDMKGNLVLANESIAHMSGFNDVTELYRSFRDFAKEHELITLDGQKVPIEDWPIQKILNGQTIQNLEYLVRNKELRRNWYMSYTGQPVLDDSGNQFLGVLIVRDITQEKMQEQKRQEEQTKYQNMLKYAKDQAESANEAKSRFLANMSHELRTPLTAVLGFTEVLKDMELSREERQDALERVERSGRTLLRLIDDVLDIAKIEAGKIEIRKNRFSPRAMVAEVLAQFDLQSQQKDIKISSVFHSTVPDMSFSDETRVRQILTNLIGNAVKFTSVGEIKVHVSTEEQPDTGKQYLVFEIDDTGIGIAENDQKKLFQPFTQADASVTRKFGGTGLGLVLAKRMCEELGGDLKLHSSEIGKGSSFVARIEAGPFLHSNMAFEPIAGKGAQVEASATQSPLKGVRVLVAEDVADNQVLIQMHLQNAGATVDLADDGVEAIQKVQETDYDVILMDIQMPNLDGLQATQKLRAAGIQVPIVALTAHAMPEEIDRSFKVGCNEHITKPVKKANLIQIVHKWSQRNES